MDTVRSLLLLSPARIAASGVPGFTPDATLLDLSDLDAEQRPAAAEAAQTLLAAGHRLYLHLHEVQTQQVRDDLLACLSDGVYGVSVPGLISVAQLQYVDGLLEELERRAGITLGLTAIGAWIDSAKGLVLVNDLARGSHRLTWLGVDEAALAAEIGVDAQAAAQPLEYAWFASVFAAQANGLPAVNGPLVDADTETELAAAQLARQAGLRGMVTRYENAAPRFNDLFPEAAPPEPPTPEAAA